MENLHIILFVWVAASLLFGALYGFVRYQRKRKAAEWEARLRRSFNIDDSVAHYEPNELRDRVAPHRRPMRETTISARRVKLSRQQVTRLNTQRRLAKRPPLSAEGVRRAIVAAPPPSGAGPNDWLLYFLIYNAMESSEHSQHDDIGTGVEIFHPGGGQFGGAGATSTWTDNTSPDAMSQALIASAATAAAGQAIVAEAIRRDALDDGMMHKSAAPGGETSDPTPPAVESSRSESSESSSTSSYDSSSSYSSSSDSGGGSSGGDSGGGGGGGGE